MNTPSSRSPAPEKPERAIVLEQSASGTYSPAQGQDCTVNITGPHRTSVQGVLESCIQHEGQMSCVVRVGNDEENAEAREMFISLENLKKMNQGLSIAFHRYRTTPENVGGISGSTKRGLDFILQEPPQPTSKAEQQTAKQKTDNERQPEALKRSLVMIYSEKEKAFIPDEGADVVVDVPLGTETVTKGKVISGSAGESGSRLKVALEEGGSDGFAPEVTISKEDLEKANGGLGIAFLKTNWKPNSSERKEVPRSGTFNRFGKKITELFGAGSRKRTR